MYTKLKKINEGFTIVETLIVLAIAALILIIVLIAVPDLQRSGKNTNTTTDANNIATTVQSFEGNNDGAIPTAISQPATDGTITVSTGTVAAPTGAVATGHIQASEAISPQSGAYPFAAASPSTDGTIVVDFSASCTLATAGQTFPTGATGTTTVDSRGVAILYEIETSSTKADWYCVQE